MRRLLVALCFLLAGCQPQKAPEPKKVAHLNLAQSPISMDPRIGGDRRSQILTRMLFEGLMRTGPSGIPELALAKEVHVSDDWMHYTFILRDATWTDGSPITAHDYEYSWKAICNPAFPTVYTTALYNVKGARAAKRGEGPLSAVGIRAVSDKELVVELDRPTPYFLHCVANGTLFPVQAGIDEKNPRWSHKVPSFVSNGPFRLIRWDQDAKIVVEKNPDYWDADNVHLDQIAISIMDDARNVLDLFEKGEIHWAGEPLSELPVEALTKLRQEGRLQVEPVLGIYRYEMNIERPPFTSLKMRQAFAHAIDREALVQYVLKGEESVAHSLLPASLTMQEQPYFASGREGARALFEEALEEAGWTRETMPKITLTYTSLVGQKAIAQAVQQQWCEAFDIPISFELLEWNLYLNKCGTCDYQIAGVTWNSWYDDPIFNLENLKNRGERFNPTLWENADYCAALDASDRAPTAEERRAFLKKAEDIVLEEMPVIPVFTTHYKYVIDPRLTDVYISKPGSIDFKWADLKNS